LSRARDPKPKSAEVEKGDYVMTSGLGGVFPKGLMVGTISEITKTRRGMFQNIEIKPAVDFSQLEYLIIIMKKYSLTED
jgi:rod shape-determining protein MreC